MSDPVFPRGAASAAIFRGDDVLLIQRGKGALKGCWSLPGGHIEPGEPARDAALREVRKRPPFSYAMARNLWLCAAVSTTMP